MADTRCSTMHCKGRAEIKNMPRDGKWWDPIANPAPFCPKCMTKTGVSK